MLHFPLNQPIDSCYIWFHVCEELNAPCMILSHSVMFFIDLQGPASSGWAQRWRCAWKRCRDFGTVVICVRVGMAMKWVWDQESTLHRETSYLATVLLRVGWELNKYVTHISCDSWGEKQRVSLRNAFLFVFSKQKCII